MYNRLYVLDHMNNLLMDTAYHNANKNVCLFFFETLVSDALLD